MIKFPIVQFTDSKVAANPGTGGVAILAAGLLAVVVALGAGMGTAMATGSGGVTQAGFPAPNELPIPGELTDYPADLTDPDQITDADALPQLDTSAAITGSSSSSTPDGLDSLDQYTIVQGYVRDGAGTCFPDAVLMDCQNQIVAQLKSPGGAQALDLHEGHWVRIVGTQRDCVSGGQYIWVQQINRVASPCGGAQHGTDLAEGRPVTASSAQSSHPPQHAVDGNPATSWASAPSNADQWIYVDLGSYQQVQRIHMQWHVGRHARIYSIYGYSSQCGGWCGLGYTRRGDGDDTLTLSQPIAMRYVLLWLDEPAYTPPYELREWSVYGTGGTLPPSSQNLAAGRPAVAYDSAPGTSPGAVTDTNSATVWTSRQVPTWIYVDLGAPYHVNQSVIQWAEGHMASRYSLYAWTGYNWNSVYYDGSVTSNPSIATFGTVRTRYLLLYAIDAPTGQISVGEFQIYGSSGAALAAPADGTIVEGVTPTLRPDSSILRSLPIDRSHR